MPPKPAHIALALSSGVFNGHRLEPNDPRRHPPLLAKGSFERELVEVSQQVDSHGAVTGAIEIERPRLRLTILRLDDYSFHTLGAGTVPTGDEDPARWNAADLIASYDRSLAGLLARQFPALHDPQRPSDRIALPRLARKPFRAQGEAIQASLKLLARGTNPFLVAEVGTGKSTMALAVAAALSPEHHGATLAELRRVGQRASLPVVRKTLIVCPPHLLKGWTRPGPGRPPGGSGRGAPHARGPRAARRLLSPDPRGREARSRPRGGRGTLPPVRGAARDDGLDQRLPAASLPGRAPARGESPGPARRAARDAPRSEPSRRRPGREPRQRSGPAPEDRRPPRAPASPSRAAPRLSRDLSGRSRRSSPPPGRIPGTSRALARRSSSISCRL